MADEPTPPLPESGTKLEEAFNKVKESKPVKIAGTALTIAKWATLPLWGGPYVIAKTGAWLWNHTSGVTAKSLTAAFTLAAMAAYGGAALYTAAYTTAVASDSIVPWSDGTNRGTIAKVREKGRFWPCKTWEVDLAMDTLARNDSGSVSNRFHFTVREFGLLSFGKPETIRLIEEYSRAGKTLEVHYSESQFDNERFSDEPTGFFNGMLSCVQKSPYTVDKKDIKVVDPVPAMHRPAPMIPSHDG